MFKYESFIDSDLCSVESCVLNILDGLSLHIKSDDLLYDVRLVLNELLINAVEHGNKYCKDKKVQCKVELNSDGLMIYIKDEGGGICKENCKKPSDYSTCGRGLLIVKHLSKEMIIKNNSIIAIIAI